MLASHHLGRTAAAHGSRNGGIESRFVLHLVRQHHRLEETLNGEQPEPGLGGRQSAQAVCDVEEFVQPLAWVDGGRIL